MRALCLAYNIGMEEIEDPTIRQPHCAECGLGIRSQSFQVEEPYYQYTEQTEGGLVRRGAVGLPRPRPFAAGAIWVHDDPRGTAPVILGRGDHVIEPQAFGPRHTHETDYERQLRNWRMQQMEARGNLGKQFTGEE